MSKYSVFLKTPDYLAQWLRHEFWNDETGRVEFARGSAPRAVIQSLVTRRPADYVQPCTDGLLPVEIPTFKGVNPAVYNHLTEQGKKALVSTCKRMFQAMLWQELNPLFDHDVMTTDVIYAFMERHGIEREERNWETIRQMYARLRKRTRSQS